MNPRPTWLLLAVLALTTIGCQVTYTRINLRDGILLRRLEGEQGATVTYRLYWDGSAPKVHRTTTTFSDLPNLGIEIRTITPEVAERRSLPAFQGVIVDHVVPDSAAAGGGIRPGDVILRIGGRDISGGEQFAHVVRTELSIGEEVEFEVRRGFASADDLDSPEVSTGRVVPNARRVETSRTDVIALEHSPGIASLTGIQVVGLPRSVAQDVYGSEEPVVLVGGVTPGSPAYRAGFRTGDRVLRCDGRPVHTVADLRAAVHARAAARSIAVNFDEVELATPDPPGARATRAEEASGPLRLEVDGPLGPHAAELVVSRTVGDARELDIPILLEYESDVERTRSSFLDFVFQFGWNYRSRYLSSSTREPARERHLSVLPFGMFELHTEPGRRRYTVLWFITFGSRR